MLWWQLCRSSAQKLSGSSCSRFLGSEETLPFQHGYLFWVLKEQLHFSTAILNIQHTYDNRVEWIKQSQLQQIKWCLHSPFRGHKRIREILAPLTYRWGPAASMPLTADDYYMLTEETLTHTVSFHPVGQWQNYPGGSTGLTSEPNSHLFCPQTEEKQRSNTGPNVTGWTQAD